MKPFLLSILLSASLLAATSNSDRARLDRVEYILKLQEETNDYALKLHNESLVTDTNQNDTLAYLLETNSKLQEKLLKLEKRVKLLEMRTK